MDGCTWPGRADYDAVVLDLMLPGLSGYQVLRRLRAERNWVPVLILSAKDGEYDQADGLDLGADDYMTKAVLLRGAPRPGCAPCCAAAPGRAPPCWRRVTCASTPARTVRRGEAGHRADRQGVRAARST